MLPIRQGRRSLSTSARVLRGGVSRRNNEGAELFYGVSTPGTDVSVSGIAARRAAIHGGCGVTAGYQAVAADAPARGNVQR